MEGETERYAVLGGLAVVIAIGTVVAATPARIPWWLRALGVLAVGVAAHRVGGIAQLMEDGS